MVFKEYVVSLILALMGEFIKDLDRKAVKVSLLRGLIELKNVELNPTLMLNLGLPYSISRAVIGSISIRVPWTSLYSKRCEIHVSDVFIVVTPIVAAPYDVNNQAHADEKRKASQLKLFEKAVTAEEGTRRDAGHRESQPETEEDSPAQHRGNSSSFLKRLQRAILEKIMLEFTNVVLRFEDVVSTGESEGVAGSLMIENVLIQPASNGNNPEDLNSTELSHREITFSGFALAVRKLQKSEGNPKRDDVAISELLLDGKIEDAEAFNSEVVKRVHKDADMFGYVIGKSRGKIDVWTQSFGAPQTIAHPKLLCTGEIFSGSLFLGRNKVEACKMLAQVVVQAARLKIARATRPFRIRPRRGEGAVAWWHHAIAQTLREVRERRARNSFDWATYLQWKEDCSTYFFYYLYRTLDAPRFYGPSTQAVHAGSESENSDDDNDDDVGSPGNARIIVCTDEDGLALEAKLSVADIIQCRAQARLALAVYVRDGVVIPRHFGENMVAAQESFDGPIRYRVAAVEVILMQAELPFHTFVAALLDGGVARSRSPGDHPDGNGDERASFPTGSTPMDYVSTRAKISWPSVTLVVEKSDGGRNPQEVFRLQGKSLTIAATLSKAEADVGFEAASFGHVIESTTRTTPASLPSIISNVEPPLPLFSLVPQKGGGGSNSAVHVHITADRTLGRVQRKHVAFGLMHFHYEETTLVDVLLPALLGEAIPQTTIVDTAAGVSHVGTPYPSENPGNFPNKENQAREQLDDESQSEMALARVRKALQMRGILPLGGATGTNSAVSTPRAPEAEEAEKREKREKDDHTPDTLIAIHQLRFSFHRVSLIADQLTFFATPCRLTELTTVRDAVQVNHARVHKRLRIVLNEHTVVETSAAICEFKTPLVPEAAEYLPGVEIDCLLSATIQCTLSRVNEVKRLLAALTKSISSAFHRPHARSRSPHLAATASDSSHFHPCKIAVNFTAPQLLLRCSSLRDSLRATDMTVQFKRYADGMHIRMHSPLWTCGQVIQRLAILVDFSNGKFGPHTTSTPQTDPWFPDVPRASSVILVRLAAARLHANAELASQLEFLYDLFNLLVMEPDDKPFKLFNESIQHPSMQVLVQIRDFHLTIDPTTSSPTTFASPLAAGGIDGVGIGGNGGSGALGGMSLNMRNLSALSSDKFKLSSLGLPDFSRQTGAASTVGGGASIAATSAAGAAAHAPTRDTRANENRTSPWYGMQCGVADGVTVALQRYDDSRMELAVDLEESFTLFGPGGKVVLPASSVVGPQQPSNENIQATQSFTVENEIGKASMEERLLAVPAADATDAQERAILTLKMVLRPPQIQAANSDSVVVPSNGSAPAPLPSSVKSPTYALAEVKDWSAVFSTLDMAVSAKRRCVVLHIDVLMGLLQTFNTPFTPLHRIRSVGNRMHFTLQVPPLKVYNVAPWGQKLALDVVLTEGHLLYPSLCGPQLRDATGETDSGIGSSSTSTRSRSSRKEDGWENQAATVTPRETAMASQSKVAQKSMSADSQYGTEYESDDCGDWLYARLLVPQAVIGFIHNATGDSAADVTLGTLGFPDVVDSAGAAQLARHGLKDRSDLCGKSGVGGVRVSGTVTMYGDGREIVRDNVTINRDMKFSVNATTAWKEGTNVPSGNANVLVLPFRTRDDLALWQIFMRGLGGGGGGGGGSQVASGGTGGLSPTNSGTARPSPTGPRDRRPRPRLGGGRNVEWSDSFSTGEDSTSNFPTGSSDGTVTRAPSTIIPHHRQPICSHSGSSAFEAPSERTPAASVILISCAPAVIDITPFSVLCVVWSETVCSIGPAPGTTVVTIPEVSVFVDDPASRPVAAALFPQPMMPTLNAPRALLARHCVCEVSSGVRDSSRVRAEKSKVSGARDRLPPTTPLKRHGLRDRRGGIVIQLSPQQRTVYLSAARVQLTEEAAERVLFAKAYAEFTSTESELLPATSGGTRRWGLRERFLRCSRKGSSATAPAPPLPPSGTVRANLSHGAPSIPLRIAGDNVSFVFSWKSRRLNRQPHEALGTAEAPREQRKLLCAAFRGLSWENGPALVLDHGDVYFTSVGEGGGAPFFTVSETPRRMSFGGATAASVASMMDNDRDATSAFYDCLEHSESGDFSHNVSEIDSVGSTRHDTSKRRRPSLSPSQSVLSPPASPWSPALGTTHEYVPFLGNPQTPLDDATIYYVIHDLSISTEAQERERIVSIAPLTIDLTSENYLLMFEMFYCVRGVLSSVATRRAAVAAAAGGDRREQTSVANGGVGGGWEIVDGSIADSTAHTKLSSTLRALGASETGTSNSRSGTDSFGPGITYIHNPRHLLQLHAVMDPTADSTVLVVKVPEVTVVLSGGPKTAPQRDSVVTASRHMSGGNAGDTGGSSVSSRAPADSSSSRILGTAPDATKQASSHRSQQSAFGRDSNTTKPSTKSSETSRDRRSNTTNSTCSPTVGKTDSSGKKPFQLRMRGFVATLYPDAYTCALQTLSVKHKRERMLYLRELGVYVFRFPFSAYSCSAKSLAVDFHTTAMLGLFSFFVRAPFLHVAPLYAATPPAAAATASVSTPQATSNSPPARSEALVVRNVDTALWKLTENLTLSRDTQVIHFSSNRSNSIVVDLGGFTLLVTHAMTKDDDIVMVVDDGMTVLFRNGSISLPVTSLGSRLAAQMLTFGEEVVFLPFVALGEGSFIESENVRFSFACEVAETPASPLHESPSKKDVSFNNSGLQQQEQQQQEPPPPPPLPGTPGKKRLVAVQRATGKETPATAANVTAPLPPSPSPHARNSSGSLTMLAPEPVATALQLTIESFVINAHTRRSPRMMSVQGRLESSARSRNGDLERVRLLVSSTRMASLPSKRQQLKPAPFTGPSAGVASIFTADSGAAMEIVRPFTIDVSISSGKDYAIAVGNVHADLTRGDVLLLHALSQEVQVVQWHVRQMEPAAESAYSQLIASTMSWRMQPGAAFVFDAAKGSGETVVEDARGDRNLGRDIDEDAKEVRRLEEGIQRRLTRLAKGQSGTLALVIPLVRVTLSDSKYPLMRVALRDVIVKKVQTSRDSSLTLQNQNIHLEVYGKGRWDTIVTPRNEMKFTSQTSWSRQNSSSSYTLHWDMLTLRSSRLLFSKTRFVNRQIGALVAVLGDEQMNALQRRKQQQRLMLMTEGPSGIAQLSKTRHKKKSATASFNTSSMVAGMRSRPSNSVGSDEEDENTDNDADGDDAGRNRKNVDRSTKMSNRSSENSRKSSRSNSSTSSSSFDSNSSDSDNGGDDGTGAMYSSSSGVWGDSGEASPQDNATHRFVNMFGITFYLALCDDTKRKRTGKGNNNNSNSKEEENEEEEGDEKAAPEYDEFVPLLPYSTVDISVLYSKAATTRVRMYPEYCVTRIEGSRSSSSSPSSSSSKSASSSSSPRKGESLIASGGDASAAVASAGAGTTVEATGTASIAATSVVKNERSALSATVSTNPAAATVGQSDASLMDPSRLVGTQLFVAASPPPSLPPVSSTSTSRDSDSTGSEDDESGSTTSDDSGSGQMHPIRNASASSSSDSHATTAALRLNKRGRQYDLSHSSFLVSELRYGHALGLVVDDILVVMSCLEGDDEAALTPLQGSNPTGALAGANASLAGSFAGALGSSSSIALTPPVRAPVSFGDADKTDEDLSGVVVVRVHSKITVRNETGMLLNIQQFLVDDDREDPLTHNSSMLYHGGNYHLRGSCSNLRIRAFDGTNVYMTDLNIINMSTSVFLNLHVECESSERRVDPIIFFVALQRIVLSSSTVFVFYPRLSILNHTGVPINLSAWQLEYTATFDNSKSGSNNNSSSSFSGGGKKSSSLQQQQQQQQRYVAPENEFLQVVHRLGVGEDVAHGDSVPVCRCTYESNLYLNLRLMQPGGEIIKTREPVEVVPVLRHVVDRDPVLIRTRDSNGRSFYVHVMVLHRTIVITVALWVYNLSEYPLLLSDSFLSHRLSAGLMEHTGVPPSQGQPFLLGCKTTDFPNIFFKVGLDAQWSSGVSTDLGSRGVVECMSEDGTFARSCNYILQFPRIQVGRPPVILLSPRWIFVNNTRRRLSIRFLTSKESAVERAREHETGDGASADAWWETAPSGLTFATLVSSVVLRPGEFHVSCVGYREGNWVAFKDILEDTLPSVTSISSTEVKERDLNLFYESMWTSPFPVDGPGRAALNLWTRSKHASTPSSWFPTETSAYSSRSRQEQASSLEVVTGRICVEAKESDNALAVVVTPVTETNIMVQNRARDVTVIARQDGTTRRNLIPPCQNCYFLWESDQLPHVIRVHISGWKGEWFELDFTRGACRVRRRRFVVDKEPSYKPLAPFCVRTWVSSKRNGAVTVLVTRRIPASAPVESWRSYRSFSFKAPLLKLVWLAESQRRTSTAHQEPLMSLVAKGLTVEAFEAEHSRKLTIEVATLQCVDEVEKRVAIHRAVPLLPYGRQGHYRILYALQPAGWLQSDETMHVDLAIYFAAIKSEDGGLRVCEMTFRMPAYAITMTDQGVARLVLDMQGKSIATINAIQQNMVEGSGRRGTAQPQPRSAAGRTRGGGRRAAESKRKVASSAAILSGSLLSHQEYIALLASRLVDMISDPSSPGGAASGSAGTTANATSSAGSGGAKSGGDRALPSAFVENVKIGRITLFVTLTRHRPDPLRPILGMYTLMLPSKLQETVFEWIPYEKSSDHHTAEAVGAKVRHWLMEGLKGQWAKMTKLGRVTEAITSSMQLALEPAPPPLSVEAANESMEEDGFGGGAFEGEEEEYEDGGEYGGEGDERWERGRRTRNGTNNSGTVQDVKRVVPSSSSSQSFTGGGGAGSRKGPQNLGGGVQTLTTTTNTNTNNSRGSPSRTRSVSRERPRLQEDTRRSYDPEESEK